MRHVPVALILLYMNSNSRSAKVNLHVPDALLSHRREMHKSCDRS